MAEAAAAPPPGEGPQGLARHGPPEPDRPRPGSTLPTRPVPPLPALPCRLRATHSPPGDVAAAKAAIEPLAAGRQPGCARLDRRCRPSPRRGLRCRPAGRPRAGRLRLAIVDTAPISEVAQRHAPTPAVPRHRGSAGDRLGVPRQQPGQRRRRVAGPDGPDQLRHAAPGVPGRRPGARDPDRAPALAGRPAGAPGGRGGRVSASCAATRR